MNYCLLLIFALSITFNCFSQIGIGGPPDPKATLNVSGNSKGLLIPRMSTSERDLITAPVPNGLMLYNTSLNKFQYYDSTTWTSLGDSPEIILPFASASFTHLVSNPDGSGKAYAIIGASNSQGGFDSSEFKSYINFMAFSMPRHGIITSFSAHFSKYPFTPSTPEEFTITAQLYSAPPASNNFMPIPGASIILRFPALSASDAIMSGITSNLTIPITAQTRLVMAINCSNPNYSVSVYGVTNAGVTIR